MVVCLSHVCLGQDRQQIIKWCGLIKPNTILSSKSTNTHLHGHMYTHTFYVVDEMMVALLDSGQREVVYCTCGVLVNLMADPTHRDVLATNSGIRKLVKLHTVQKLLHFAYYTCTYTCNHKSIDISRDGPDTPIIVIHTWTLYNYKRKENSVQVRFFYNIIKAQSLVLLSQSQNFREAIPAPAQLQLLTTWLKVGPT